ncbi:hypothetical protein [Hydrogenophaga sp. 5NK40-0174]|uniref:hypothetical protein n=1 Tax=Hydrogenophaga sp. 5NK40-0174 TaxID=3127649 RepID=UPI003340A927
MLTAVGYGVWFAFNLAIAIAGFGDGGVSSHLSLLFTGFPAALASLALQHASVAAVVVAGILGLFQWVVVAWLFALSKVGARGA